MPVPHASHLGMADHPQPVASDAHPSRITPPLQNHTRRDRFFFAGFFFAMAQLLHEVAEVLADFVALVEVFGDGAHRWGEAAFEDVDVMLVQTAVILW